MSWVPYEGGGGESHGWNSSGFRCTRGTIHSIDGTDSNGTEPSFSSLYLRLGVGLEEITETRVKIHAQKRRKASANPRKLARNPK